MGLLWVLAAVCSEWGLLIVAVYRRLISWASPVVGHGREAGMRSGLSVVIEMGLQAALLKC